MKVVVVDQNLVTALGHGVDPCWAGVLSGRPVFSGVTRFSTQAFAAHIAALVPGLDAARPDSLVMQMLVPLLSPLAGTLPDDTLVLLATTTGEVDLLQRELLQTQPTPNPSEEGISDLRGVRGGFFPARLGQEQSSPEVLLGRLQALLGITAPGRVISAACASSSAAVAHGAALIASGRREAVLIVACDAVTEFIYAGFASMMALDPDGARPFDRARKGLTVGEGAGYVLLMSEARAVREGRKPLGVVAGWGLSCDANHMTGPSRDGDGLAQAMIQALKIAERPAPWIGSLSAHGTGTSYNDSMEMKAFKRVFTDQPLPVYSVKGCMGHTMGLAGLAEMVLALKSLECQVIPPSANLGEVDPEADGWVSGVAATVSGMQAVLSTNSGFGGVNAALVLTL
jgi:3-oxoacyl-[acyl-carrier-protein] synthase II